MNDDRAQADRTAPSAPLVAYLAYPEEQGRSLELGELVAECWRRKWLIAALTGFFVAAGIAWALLATPIFRVEVVLAPVQSSRAPALSGRLGGLASLAGLNLNTGSDNTQAFAVLSSRAFSESFIVDKRLLPSLYPDEWDADAKAWKNANALEQPSVWEGVKFFTEEVLFLDQDEVSGLVTLAVEWSDPQVAAAWAQQLVDRINEQLRTRDLDQAERKLAYLNDQLAEASLLETRQAIASVIEDQIQTITLAKGETEYAFRVIDPPRVPMERERPKRTLIVVLAALAGGLVSLCVVLVMYLWTPRRQLAR
jgi:uncharacterized protein involved in exopolysaccharide biosynthesis